ncbi:TetR/AcrR family transcriptional regulator [Flexivirga sp. ID2601S]|uniref:TetR/AcrR family transcriptional regulator n=1 Tax=Flexivirga aerilata TaxID=1656889 RepID=A0A849AIN8_9MICO|nr:TetR/AcrR family transcriptional regulator [Flexivirga aerilata]
MPDTRGRYAESLRNDKVLLAGARRAVARRGADVSVADIAAESGLGVGSIYRRFASKEAVLQYLCTLALEQVATAAEQALAIPPSWSTFAGFVESVVEFEPGSLATVAAVVTVTDDMWSSALRVRALLADVLRRAQEAGLVRVDITVLDLQAIIVQLGRPSPGLSPQAQADVRSRLVTVTLDGLRPQSYSTLPGEPPTEAGFDDIWRPSSDQPGR